MISYVNVPLRDTTPILPGLQMFPGMMPTLLLPGEMSPGQFGPISRAARSCTYGDGCRNVDDGGVCLRFMDRLGDRVEDRHGVLEPLPAFSGRHSGDNLRAVGHHLLGMERAVAAGDPLHHQAGRLIDEDAHAAFPLTFATACFTASSMSVSAENPALVRISTASCSFVPMRRMTIGTWSGNSRVA